MRVLRNLPLGSKAPHIKYEQNFIWWGASPRAVKLIYSRITGVGSICVRFFFVASQKVMPSKSKKIKGHKRRNPSKKPSKKRFSKNVT